MIDDKLRTRLVGRIVTDEGLPEDLAERILDQALGFLRLASEQPDEHYGPSPMVDIGWHTFILYTRSYDKFCRELTGGRFIHHEPTDDPDAAGEGEEKNPRMTMLAMKAAGIVVDEPLWAYVHSADCSDCTASDGDGDQGCKSGPCNY